MINEFVISLILGGEKEYLSSDSSCKVSNWITLQFFNKIKCSWILNHKIVFKKGVPIMSLKNIAQISGFCKGIRLIIEKLRKNIITAIDVSRNQLGKRFIYPE